MAESNNLSCEQEQELEQIAQQLVTVDKGVLAADEATATISTRLANIGVENTEENRRVYRCDIM